MAPPLECPFCSFKVSESDLYVLQLHIEELHTEDSPFVVKDSSPSPSSSTPQQQEYLSKDGSSDDTSDQYVSCPEEGCGEEIPLVELNDHLDLHLAEKLILDDHSNHSKPTNTYKQAIATSRSSSKMEAFSTDIHESLRHEKRRKRADTAGSDKTTLSRTILDFVGFSPKQKYTPEKNVFRLGRKELGPYAYEEKMPRWLYNQLQEGPKITFENRISRDGRIIKQEKVENETPGLVPVLAQLSAVDQSVQEAWFCHPAAVHVCSTKNEGGFCGYRNMQMLVSYMQGAHAQGHQAFPGRTPGILWLQDRIEEAWDKGIGTEGRTQTGGIKGSRKYIGTPEIHVLLQSLNVQHHTGAFFDSNDGYQAHDKLLDFVEDYFKLGQGDEQDRIHKTLLPPIYLQQPGHSITVVGFERRANGSRNLLVFDPMFKPSKGICELLGRTNIRTPRTSILNAHRRGPEKLAKYDGFETITLTAPPPVFPAWTVIELFHDVPYIYVFYNYLRQRFEMFPEHDFTHSFPWFDYGAMFCMESARFACVPRMAMPRVKSIDGIPALIGQGFRDWHACDCSCDQGCWFKRADVEDIVEDFWWAAVVPRSPLLLPQRQYYGYGQQVPSLTTSPELSASSLSGPHEDMEVDQETFKLPVYQDYKAVEEWQDACSSPLIQDPNVFGHWPSSPVAEIY